MDTSFQFKIIWWDNDVEQIRISASNGLFAGGADVYVGIGQLQKAAAQIRGFPNNPADKREISFGSFEPKTAGGGVSMLFYCRDGAGHGFVDAKIESELDRSGKAQSVMLSLPIEATGIDAFVEELDRLSRDKTKTATLKGKSS